MDYLSHGLWSYIFFNKTKKPWYAVLFGMVPDTLSWAIFFVFAFFTGTLFAGPPNVESIPQWTFLLYGITHSLVVSIAAILVVYFVTKKFPIYMLAWPIAVVMDMFTHTRDFLPTPILWPVSGWVFPGISWGSATFMIANYVLIISCFVYIYLKRKKGR